MDTRESVLVQREAGLAEEDDGQSMLLSINPTFAAILDRSRRRVESQGGLSSDEAFLAMAHHALGESDKAREYLKQLTDLCEQPAWKASLEVIGFLEEKRQRLATPQ
jgi:hypothetical protein